MASGLQEAAHQIRDADAAITLTAADIPARCANASENPLDVAVDVEHDLAHLAYTGGTTGAPKGVRLTHRQVAPYQKLRELHFIEHLPTSGAGKTLKRQLRDRLDANYRGISLEG